MNRSQNIDLEIERERRNLIARLAQVELNTSLARKLHTLLFASTEQAKQPSMPCAMTAEELVLRLRKDRDAPSQEVSHEEFLQEAAKW